MLSGETVPELVEHRNQGLTRGPHDVFLIWHRRFVCLGYSVAPALEVAGVDRLLDPRAAQLHQGEGRPRHAPQRERTPLSLNPRTGGVAILIGWRSRLLISVRL